MNNALATQFKLTDDGQILFQEEPSNPLPGEPVAQITKGDSPLAPGVVLAAGIEAGRQSVIENWLKTHIAQVLEPLVGLLENIDNLAAPVQSICAHLFKAMGIVPREELEAFIAELDADMRRDLRTKKVRLGPILVFQPDLNKPAAVRLRSMLWSLAHDKSLPAPVPNDGIVSLAVSSQDIDPAFYQAIGYPVYGPRAIRIDMLDRVICAVYDSAEGGQFQAQHQMAEWLGCGIEDLYAVLEAMGHKKASDTAASSLCHPEGAKQPEGSQDNPGDPSLVAQDDNEVKEQKKPELATFYLKKGRANQKATPRPKKAAAPRKEKSKEKKKGKRNKSTNRSPKIMSAGPKLKQEDSPFAVLAQLKDQKDAG